MHGHATKSSQTKIFDQLETGKITKEDFILEIQKIGANIKYSLSVFDRNEGGVEKIRQYGINHYSIFKYDLESESLIY